MKDKIIAGTGQLSGSTGFDGQIDAKRNATGSITGTVDGELNLIGTVELEDRLNGAANYSGAVGGKVATEGAETGIMTIRIGQDGADGKDGFSPTIVVERETKSEYILKITDVNGSYLTPNLIPDIEGLEDIETLVAGKVDEDLKEYPLIDPNHLSVDQRDVSYLYLNADGRPTKIALSDVALVEDVERNLKTKLQTVDDVPTKEDWRVGDYIFLDLPTENNN